MQKLCSVQEEQEQRIHDAIMKTSGEYEKAQRKLEEKLEERSKQLANLAIENTQLSKALLTKEKVIEELQKQKSQADAEFNVLMSRLDSVEKENTYVKYEFHILEKELEIRNEEMEYNRRSADAAHKQHLESVKKATKLEAECQRLRLLMQKRLPGPAAMANMQSEVYMLGRNHTDMRRRKQNPTRDLIVREATKEASPEIPSKKISFMIERLRDVEEENKALKEIITKKNTELHSSRIMYARTASRLSQTEAHVTELSKCQKSMELTRYSPISSELSLLAGSEIGSDDGISSSGSWANALISELEHCRNAKLKNPLAYKAASDMSFMDDFVEMEKLAIVSVDTPRSGCYPNRIAKDLVPFSGHSGLSDSKQEMQLKTEPTEKTFDWLQVVLQAMLEQKRISKRSLHELFEDIKIALGYINHPTTHEVETTAIPRHPGVSDPLHASGYTTLKSPNTSPLVDSSNGASAIDTSVEEKGSQCNLSNLSKSIHKIIKLIDGVNPTSSFSRKTPADWSKRDQNSKPFPPATSADYFVRVFQWKSSELSAVLQQFVCTCTDLLNGKAGIEKFVMELMFSLDWIINNHVSPKDASSARNKIKKHFGWMESQTENEPGIHTSEEQSLCLPFIASSHDQDVLFQMEDVHCKLQEENSRLKDELKNQEAAKKDMEARLQSATGKIEVLMTQLRESEQSIGNLRAELETKGMIEDQIENQKLINEDLDTQLTVSKAKLNEVFQKFSSLEVELEDKNNCCEDLEATCLELQLQLESVAKETPKYSLNQQGKQSQNGWEITTASIKLAECQETILHLGKQLKALASPRETVLFDKVFCNTSAAAPTTDNKKLNKRSSLRDRMIAEDDTKAEILKSPKIKETTSTADTQKQLVLHSDSYNASCALNALVHTPESFLGSKHKGGNNAVGALAFVPSKKQGGFGLLRKLLLRRKKGSSRRS
ncbi:filament-like plant protein 7 isoform X2 [Alnus glutinosa]|nr:filament-like plant protein 7 isoform X2 [Alnus glutinosa]